MRKSDESSSTQSCGCDWLGMTPEIFAGFAINTRAELALKMFWHMLKLGKYPEIVKMTVLIPPSREEIVAAIVAQENSLDRLGRENEEVKIKNTDSLKNLFSAIDASCAQEIQKNVWTHSLEAQQLLLKFARESEEGLDSWREIILRNFLEGKCELIDIGCLARDQQLIVSCIEMFGLPREKIKEKIESMVLDWTIEASVNDWLVLSKSIKILIDGFGISKEKVNGQLAKRITMDGQEYPKGCVAAAGVLGLSLEPWKDIFVERAKQYIIQANKESCLSNRLDEIKSACEIFAALKKDYGEVRGNIYLEMWDNREERIPEIFLRKASRLLNFRYRPRGIKDWWHSIAG